MKGNCFFLIIWTTLLIGCSLVKAEDAHKLVKRQFPSRSGGGGFPLSRRRQFPPPEELEESEYVDSDEDVKNAAPAFRGRQPPASPEEDYPDDGSYTEAPKLTTPSPAKPTSRIAIFNNRFNSRARFGSQNASTSSTKPPASSLSSGRATPAQSQRLDVVASILNRPPPARSAARAIPPARTANANVVKTPEPEVSTRRSSTNLRPRGRGRLRTRTSSTTTTTTTTTQAPQPPEEYYYYYEDEEDSNNKPIATTTSTTTTTTTPRPRPSISRPRPVSTRTRTPSRTPVKFDPESQFAPPPEEPEEIKAETTRAPKRFTTSSTAKPEETIGGIPAHLRHKYKPRTDGRFIDFLRDPNRPRELKGFDLTDYPFYIVVPDDIDFDCDDRKDGYYASIPHKCQLFHYCFAGARYDFLCANYTLYDQTTFTCRFANNVDCESSAKYYFRNDDLWKETTTTEAPTKPPKRKSRPRPRDEDYDDEEYDYEEEEEEERRRRPLKRRRNRRKNRRRPSEEDEDEEKK